MPPNRNVLTLECPYCGYEHTDDYECLGSARAESMKCAACHQGFSFLIRDCLECGEESVFTWKSMPAPGALALLPCNYCGAPFHEAASEGQGQDPAQRV